MKVCIQNGIFEQWVWVVDKSPKIKNDNMIIIIFHEDVLLLVCGTWNAHFCLFLVKL
jgi:hypothetical protein